MQHTITEINSVEDAAQKAVTNTIFSPRFYTTDFDAIDRIDIEHIRPQWDALMADLFSEDYHTESNGWETY